MKADSNQRMAKPATARETAMDILTKVEQEKAFSNLLLNQSIKRQHMERIDASLVTELVYGTIQRLNTIDYYLSRFVKQGLGKLEPWVRSLLRLSFYQLYYLDRIPEHAVVNEAVTIAKRKGHQGISGLINGVLRSVIRQKAELTPPPNLSPIKRISITHSHPEWMVARWILQYGEQATENICESNNLPPHTSVRINSIKHNRAEMLEKMQDKELRVRVSEIAAPGIVVEGGGNMALTSWYADGDITVQDESSMLVAKIVDPRPGMTVLDCCAAPGGKTTHMAEIMNDQGKVWAVDIHPHKKKLIEDQANRLKLSCVETLVSDAKLLIEHFTDASFDRILLDAPCSGFGVIRRKPDLKWNKKEEEIKEIAKVQYDILSSIERLLKPGGVLVYSTCTIEHEENQTLVQKFLQNHSQFTPDPMLESYVSDELIRTTKIEGLSGMIQVLPHHYHTDGFFIARLLKKEK